MKLNKQALRVPEHKRHDWSRGVMRYCDFCTYWAITVKHEDGGNICASCCDVEYTSALKDALEVEIERADAAEKRNAELEARTVALPPTFWYEHDDLSRDVPVLDKRLVKKALRAAGIKIKGE